MTDPFVTFLMKAFGGEIPQVTSSFVEDTGDHLHYLATYDGLQFVVDMPAQKVVAHILLLNKLDPLSTPAEWEKAERGYQVRGVDAFALCLATYDSHPLAVQQMLRRRFSTQLLAARQAARQWVDKLESPLPSK